MPGYVHLQPVMSFEEIGDALGITKQGAQFLYTNGIRKLRKRGLTPALTMLAELHQRREYATPAAKTQGQNRRNWRVE